MVQVFFFAVVIIKGEVDEIKDAVDGEEGEVDIAVAFTIVIVGVAVIVVVVVAVAAAALDEGGGDGVGDGVTVATVVVAVVVVAVVVAVVVVVVVVTVAVAVAAVIATFEGADDTASDETDEADLTTGEVTLTVASTTLWFNRGFCCFCILVAVLEESDFCSSSLSPSPVLLIPFSSPLGELCRTTIFHSDILFTNNCICRM